MGRSTQELLDIWKQKGPIDENITKEDFKAIYQILAQRKIDENVMGKKNKIQETSTVEGAVSKVSTTNNKETEENFFESACAQYKLGEYDKAKRFFKTEIDTHPESEKARISQIQLDFLKSKPLSWFHPWIIVAFFILIKDISKSSRPDHAMYFWIGSITLYWIYHSIRWPIIFEAKQRYTSALSWLWIIAVYTCIAGVLEVSHIFEFLDLKDDEAMIMLISGLGILVAAYLATKFQPIAGLIIFPIVSALWAFDTATILNILLFGKNIELYVCSIAAIIHLIALSSIAHGIVGAQGLKALSKSGLPKKLSDTMEKNRIHNPRSWCRRYGMGTNQFIFAALALTLISHLARRPE